MPQAHQHNDIELNYCSSDLVYMIGGDRVTFPSGQVSAFWAAKPHQLIDGEPDSRVTWVTIPLALFLSWRVPEDAVQRLLHGEVLVASEKLSSMYSRRHFDQWGTDLETDSETGRRATTLEVEAFISRLAQIALIDREHAPRHVAADESLRRAGDMAQYIATHFREPIRIEDVARVSHVHPHYAMTIFKRVFGISINNYLIQYRVAEAQRLLLTSDFTVLHVGERAGFQSQSTFYQNFSAACGMAPASYRRVLGPRR